MKHITGKRVFRAVKTLTVCAAAAVRAIAQAPQPAPAGEVVGVGNFSHIVSDLDRSLAFYRDVLGLEVSMSQPFGPNPAIEKLGSTIGGQSRFVALKVPGTALGVELIEYRNIDRQAQHPRFYDPGAANLALRVRDLNSVFERIRKFDGAKVITAAGKPVSIDTPNGSLYVVFVQDPDGFVVELASAAVPPGAPAGNIVGGSFEVTVADSEQSVKFYNNLLGFNLQLGASFNPNQLMAETAGAPGASFRQSSASIPGTSVQMTLIEFKNIDRKPLKGRVQDPGTAILQVYVRDAAALTKKLKAAGVPVVTAGGEPVDVGVNNLKISIVRDPNNMMLELIQAPKR
jgi:catechol 2,3-dioxygenase-like lactoylglutathione lyase family enzyme